MICRMNKRQREVLIELIKAIIKEEKCDDINEAVTRMEWENEFHKCFANEGPEDDHDHA